MQIKEFKRAVAKFPTGVCVITTNFNKKKWGITANSFVSVSLVPALVSFCLDKKSNSFDAFKNSNNFSVSILAADQAEVSKHFACSIFDKFNEFDYEISKSGAPLIIGASSFLDCKKYQEIESGDHYIFIGEVLKTQIDESKSPLVYFAKSYSEIK